MEDPSLAIHPLLPEILQKILDRVSINSVINFCSTSIHYLYVCKLPEFWKSKVQNINRQKLFPTLIKALKFGISPLINTCIDELSKEDAQLGQEEIDTVFRDVMALTCRNRLSYIKRIIIMLNIKLLDIGFMAYPEDDIGPNIQKLYEFANETTHVAVDTVTVDAVTVDAVAVDTVTVNTVSSSINDVNEIVYLLVNLNKDTLAGALPQNLIQSLYLFGREQGVDYLMERTMQNFGPDKVFSELLKYFMEQDLHEEFSMYWNKYSKHLHKRKWVMLDVEYRDIDYPYRYTKMVGLNVDINKVCNSLLRCNRTQRDLFNEIWNEYKYSLDDWQKIFLIDALEKRGDHNLGWIIRYEMEDSDQEISEPGSLTL